MTRRLLFYQNMICPHESELMRALAERPGVEVTWVVDEETLKHRASMGVSRPDHGPARVTVTTDEAVVRRIVLDADAEAIHLVGGPRASVTSRAALSAALSSGRRVALFAEPGDHRGGMGVLRRTLYRYEFARWGRRLDFVLPTGELGVRWFASAGYAKSRVFPFCHVTRQPPLVAESPTAAGFSIVFCGQLIRRKRVDLLLRALAAMKRQDWTCSIIGDGPMRETLRSLADRLGLGDRINWMGVVNNTTVHRVIGAHDLLVLPSSFDGWGAVVNEALAVGTPAICSDACGAAELLRERWRGEVVAADSIPALANAIESAMAGGNTTPLRRKRIVDWSRSHASGEAAASYLMSILDHVYDRAPRPATPWR